MPTRRHVVGFGGKVAEADDPSKADWNDATANERERVGIGTHPLRGRLETASLVAVLLAKRHVLFQKKCQKPHSVSKGLTFAQVDFFA